MAPEWELANGVAPTYNAPAYLYGLPSADTLRIDDLLDLSDHQMFPSDGQVGGKDYVSAVKPESGTSSEECYYRHQMSSFPEDIYIPTEEAAELEWLSKFVEESFTDVPYPSAALPTPSNPSPPVPSRAARSKRTRIINPSVLVTANTFSQSSSSSSSTTSSSSDFPATPRKRGNGADTGIGIDESGVRRCTHCASEKTPQWRTGPLGPKTLCNACGVRFKSGRLVPEYRPAASPTFVLTQHSNSHRKVMELRRQKESRSGAVSGSSRVDLIYHDRVVSLS